MTLFKEVDEETCSKGLEVFYVQLPFRLELSSVWGYSVSAQRFLGDAHSKSGHCKVLMLQNTSAFLFLMLLDYLYFSHKLTVFCSMLKIRVHPWSFFTATNITKYEEKKIHIAVTLAAQNKPYCICAKSGEGWELLFVLLTLGNKNSLELPFIFPLHFCQVTEQNKYPRKKKNFYQSFEYFWDRNHLEVMCQGTLSVSSSPLLSLRMVLK